MRSFYASCAAAYLGLEVMEEAIGIIKKLRTKRQCGARSISSNEKRDGVKTGTQLFEYRTIQRFVFYLRPITKLFRCSFYDFCGNTCQVNHRIVAIRYHCILNTSSKQVLRLSLMNVVYF